MTAFCGVAASFAQMLVGRAAVSIGEAGCTPPAHSLISDIFPAERWTGALVVFVVAGPVGALVAAIGGGWMVQSHGWRAAFILCGVIGLALAILIRTTVGEPLRGDRGEAEALMPACARCSATAASSRSPSWGQLLQPPVYGVLPDAHAWASPCHCIDIERAGLRRRRHPNDSWRRRHDGPRTRALSPDPRLAAGGGDVLLRHALRCGFPGALAGAGTHPFFTASLGQHFYMPALFSLGQELAPPRMRAMASAIMISVTSLLGYGFGPPAVGLLSDILREAAMARHGLTAAGCAHDPVALCQAASSQGLRWSLTLGSCFFVVAGLLFALAGRCIDGDIAKSRGIPVSRWGRICAIIRVSGFQGPPCRGWGG